MNDMTREERWDIGETRRLRILCISETGWRDTAVLLEDIKAAGGMSVDQYEIRWPPLGALHPDNAAGSSALVEAEGADGTLRRILFDSGWNPAWMDQRFAEEGIDEMLASGQIEALVISHEHFDHFWGIGSALKHRPDVTVYVPQGFRQEGFDFICAAGHTGDVQVVPPGEPVPLAPGLAVVAFPMETLGKVQGENVLYARVAGKGVGMITGCGHGGVIELLEYAKTRLVGGENIYAVYGGLHISPFEDWDEKREAVVQALAGYDIRHLGCNHCTGEKAVRKMIAAGLPVIRGTARNGSKTDLFLGNGDELELGGD